MFERIRLLPILMVAIGLLFGLKVLDLVGEVMVDAGVVTSAQAVPADEEEIAADSAVPDQGAPEEGGAKPSVNAAPAPLANDSYYIDPDELTKSEIEVLQSLAERREALDRRQLELDLRENLIKAAERRVEEKIKDLKTIEARIEIAMIDRDSAQAKQIASLVKVYENMKPKVAANIFEGLEVEVMVEVMSRMKEPKLAKVMAAMNPKVARHLTQELANRNKIMDLDRQASEMPALTNPLSDGG